MVKRLSPSFHCPWLSVVAVLVVVGSIPYMVEKEREKRSTRRSRGPHGPRTYKGREPCAVITARNSSATPDARTKNERVCNSYTLAHLANCTKRRRRKRYHTDASSPACLLVVVRPRFHGSGCGECGVGEKANAASAGRAGGGGGARGERGN